MITYKSSDILKRASQLADLENSSFISWNENINLLNESYRKLYQIVINNSDKYYLKNLPLSQMVKAGEKTNETAFFLPADFYQLCAVNVGVDKSILMRRSPSESTASKRYEIINEQIVFYGGAERDGIELSYYPIPQTLSTPVPDRRLENIEDRILDCNNNGYLCLTEDGSVYVHNAAKGTDTVAVALGIDDSDHVLFGVLGRKYAVIQTNTKMFYVDLIGDTVADVTSKHFKIAKKDNELYFFKYEDDGLYTVYKESTYASSKFARSYATDVQIELPEGYTLASHDVWTFTDNLAYIYIPYQKDGEFLRLWECSGTEAKESFEVSDSVRNTIINGDLYSINYDLCVNGAKIISDSDFYSLIGFNKADGSTGYGVSVLNDDGELVVKSVYIDTELNFPNNFYFNYMAYMLAVAYKTKQNADSSGLLALADAEEMAFYDTLNRDVSNTVRITNVYGTGGRW